MYGFIVIPGIVYNSAADALTKFVITVDALTNGLELLKPDKTIN